jgi:hypothetical protein
MESPEEKQAVLSLDEWRGTKTRRHSTSSTATMQQEGSELLQSIRALKSSPMISKEAQGTLGT